jgi:putative aminopeptidase FrvX
MNLLALLALAAITSQQMEQRLHSAPAKNEERQQMIAQMFHDVGCAPALRPLRHSKFANVVCTLPGSAEGTIIVGAHFDHTKLGDGVIDNWSGATMLANLYEGLRDQPLKHTFVFVAFAREEEGLLGSRDFARQVKQKPAAMVNLDSLGMGPAVVWRNHSNGGLYDAAQTVAQALGVRLDVVNVDGAGDGDSSSFKEKKIAVIDFHSLRPETFHVLHSKDDNFGALQLEGYAESFNLIARYLAYIDMKL